MTYIQLALKLSIITALLLVPVVFVVVEVVGASEVTGTLSGGASTDSTITGTVGDAGSTVSGTIGGTSGGSTIVGTVSSGGGGATSGGGGGGGGGPLGQFGGVTNNSPGIVLGASTNAPTGNTGSGSVLGVSTGVPNTGAGGDSMATILLILSLSLASGLGAYFISRRVMS